MSVLHGMPVDWVVASLPAQHPIALTAKRFIHCNAGQHWQWDGVQFDVLNPGPWINAAQAKENNRGCVLKVSSAAGRALLPADIEQASEWELTQRSGENLASDLLLAPHHGSKTSSSIEFMNAVHPQIVMISAGYRNRFGHPKVDILNRYTASGAQVFRSDDDGAVTFRFAREGITSEAYRRVHTRYWHGK